MLRLLLPKQAHARLESRLAALGLPLEFILMDESGALWEGGQPIEAAKARPEAVWFTTEAMADKLHNHLLALIPAFGTVKWVQTVRAGLDAAGYRAIFDAGIRMTSSDSQAIAIAEYVMGHVLGEWQRLADSRAAQAKGQWTRFPLREISRSSWLIIGFGNIGRETARRAAAFGAEIVGVGSQRGQHEIAREIAVQADLPRLLPQADVVVIACPLNEQTEGMADAAFFAAMKPDSALVNIARGKIIRDDALLAALDAGRPAVAILDVFNPEPLPPDSPYWQHPRVRLTPHMSANSNGLPVRRDILYLENLQNYARGLPLRNEVRKRP